MSHIQVNMLGRFSIEKDGHTIDDSANRMRKMWLLLAYLIYSRRTAVTQESAETLLNGPDNGDGADPGGRVKAMFYRVRTQLNGLWEGAGHELIVHKQGAYKWSDAYPVQLDVEQFEQLCTAAAAADDVQQRLDLYLQALELYKGDFLPKLSMEAWVMPISTYYHQMFLTAAEQALVILEEREQWQQMQDLCRKALKIEPYSEELFCYLMRALLGLGDRAGAVRTYEEMSERLFSNFGVMPTEESRKLYREASSQMDGNTVPVASVRDMLREPAGVKGAMLCEYDFFKLLYRVQARSIGRSGDTVHIALLSLHPLGKKELSRRSLDTAMDNLQDVIVHSLRQGDIVTKCSVSQFIVMLPQANYENSGAVCQRIIKAFGRQFPHAPVTIRVSVQPLEPMAQLL